MAKLAFDTTLTLRVLLRRGGEAVSFRLLCVRVRSMLRE